MKLDQLKAGDVINYRDNTYVVSYVGRYGITTYNLNTGRVVSQQFFMSYPCTLLYKTPIRSDADIKVYFPEFTI